jgi:DHA1 family bicyclomycin/chloramphenicol resistance-like MFS transporter
VATINDGGESGDEAVARTPGGRPLGFAALIALVSSMVALGAISIDLYLPSLPGMAADLAAGEDQVQMTVGAFLIGYAVAQLVIGPLSDRFGRRAVFVVGTMIYLAATLGCALADTVETLIWLRIVQSLAACSGTVIGRAIVRDIYGRERAARAYAYLGVVVLVTPMLAPIVGAWLETAFGWRSNFYFMAGFATVMLSAVVVLLSETNVHRDATATGIGGVAANYATLLSSAAFMGYALTICFAFVGVFAFIAGGSIVIIQLLGHTPETFALLFAASAAGHALGSLLAARVTPALGIDRTIAIGVAVYFGGAVAMSALGIAGVFTAWAICAPMTLISFGSGMIMPGCQAGAIAPFPHMAGAASAMIGFLMMSGAALGGAAVAVFYDGTQHPMTWTVLAGALAVTVVYRGLIQRRSLTGTAAGSAGRDGRRP